MKDTNNFLSKIKSWDIINLQMLVKTGRPLINDDDTLLGTEVG